MFCVNCGTKNPDNAKFCCNCGVSMSASGKNPPVQRKGGFFKRLIVSMAAFAVFYVGSYAVTSLFSGDSTSDKKDTESASVVTKKETTAAASNDTGYIAGLDGYWEEVKLQDGSFNMNVSALTFYQTVYNCTGLTVNMDVTMNAGTSCKEWQVWGRSGGSFVKLAKIYLPAGNGEISQSVSFATPVTFDSIAVTPTVSGSYSWSMALGISDIYTK